MLLLVGWSPCASADIVSDIRHGESASVALQSWCQAHGAGASLTAVRELSRVKPASAEIRRALVAAPGEAIAYRRVRLMCGRMTLSEADNWYLPDRLTPAMNRALAASDRPFGLVVKALDFSRRTAPPLRGPVVRAVLATAAGTPFSYVVETYAPVLTFRPGP